MVFRSTRGFPMSRWQLAVAQSCACAPIGAGKDSIMLRILVLVGALAAGGVAAWLSFGLQPGPAPDATVSAPEPQIRTEEVLVAAADLKQGAALTGEQLRWQKWPADAVGPGYISRTAKPEAVQEFTGSVVRQAILDGEPIREAKLSGSAGYLAAMLEPGKRAVAVRVSAESSAGGFVLPNDHVDVLHSGGGGGRSLTILTNIRVLAIDQNAVDSGAGNAAVDSAARNTVVGKTATLELDPAQVEVISGAQTSGSLSLALRATADNEEPGLEFARRGPGITVRIVRSGETQTVQTDGVAR
jgi:pilus assembly protein CpaB